VGKADRAYVKTTFHHRHNLSNRAGLVAVYLTVC
jgi:hypothetical protein